MANKWIDIKPTREERRRTHRLAEFERRYEMIMPIDATGAETQCRDKFLQQLFDGMKFDDIDDKDSDLDEEIPRYSNRLSLVKFLESHRRILRTTHKLEDFKTWILDPRHFSVMTGQTNHYKELLESMKLSSLSYLFTRVIERLSAMHSITLEWVNMEAIDLEHGLFKWSMKAFFERCKLNDPVYLDVLMRNYSENLLDWVKFSEDLNEMQRYFRYFQMEMYDEKNHNQLKTIIWDQEQLINIGDEMDQMLIKSLKRFKTIEDQLREVANTLECRKMKMKIRECYHESREALIRLPMEWRYVRDYYHSIVDVEEHKDNVPLLELKKQVKELRQLMLDHEQTNFQSSCIYKLTINVCYRYRYRTSLILRSISSRITNSVWLSSQIN